MFRVLTLNNISVAGLERLPRDRYEVASEFPDPDAILLRSHDMHQMTGGRNLKAVARAGAGVNNIPVERLGGRGIPVFNTPGANANAVTELVLAGLLLAARNVCAAWRFTRELEGDDENLNQAVEAGKKRFVGFELPSRTLGVIGLGAIGVKVANAALGLGMRVIGYDNDITVRRAWQLSSTVLQASSVGDLLAHADVVSLHVPMSDQTRNLINAERLGLMRDGTVLLNFARDGLVEEEALLGALDNGRVRSYVCDFPTRALKDHERVITLPHIGASTREAEDNCAVMAVEQLRNFLEDGNITNYVNFPEVVMPRNHGRRVAVVHVNVPNMLGQISTAFARADLNIVDMLNRSRNRIAYTLTDVEGAVPESVLESLESIDGVLSVLSLS